MIACIIASFRQKATVTLQVRSRHCYACSPFLRATKNGTSMQRGPDCHSGSQATADLSASARSPAARLRQTGSRRHTIFIHNGAPQALVGCHENDAAGGPSGGLRIGFEGNAIAEAFEASFKVCDGSGLTDLVEIGCAEVATGQVLSEHVVGGDEDFVGDCERGAQAAAAGLEAVELVLEVAALGSRGGDRRTDQDRAQVDVALSGSAALLPAGTLMVAGTDARPGGQMIDAQEYA